MDDDLIRAVATTAAGLIVRAIGTAAWQAIRDRWSRALGQGAVDQESVIVDQLEESAKTLAAAEPADRERIATELEAEWRGALRAQLRSDPGLLAAVRELVDELPRSDGGALGSVSLTATVSNGTSIQSGRDSHVSVTSPRRT